MQVTIDLHDHLYLSEADLRREPAIARGSNAVSERSRDQEVNDYTCEVLNGNQGTIVDMDLEEQEVQVQFGDRVVAYDYTDLNEIALDWAVTIHKSQGSPQEPGQ